MSLLEKVDLIRDGIIELSDHQKIFQDALKAIMLLLEQNKEKLDRLLVMKPMIAVMDSPKKEPVVIEKTIIKGGTTIPKKGQGKYVWFPVKGLDKVKVRACSNDGCPYYLKYSEEKGKYEHWKYDPNTQEGGYVQDNCDYYFPEGL